MSRSRAPMPLLNESMVTMSMMDGQDTPVPRSDERQSLPVRGTPSSSSDRGSSSLDLAQYSGLKDYMGGYPAYFDSSIPEDERIQWVIDNLPSELRQFEEKRLKFEEEREEWEHEMESLRARRLLVLRREVVKRWMFQEESNWKDIRDSWALQKRTLEEMLKEDLAKLSIEAENMRRGGGPIRAPIPTRRSQVNVPVSAPVLSSPVLTLPVFLPGITSPLPSVQPPRTRGTMSPLVNLPLSWENLELERRPY